MLKVCVWTFVLGESVVNDIYAISQRTRTCARLPKMFWHLTLNYLFCKGRERIRTIFSDNNIFLFLNTHDLMHKVFLWALLIYSSMHQTRRRRQKKILSFPPVALTKTLIFHLVSLHSYSFSYNFYSCIFFLNSILFCNPLNEI